MIIRLKTKCINYVINRLVVPLKQTLLELQHNLRKTYSIKPV